jgi:hypothetical protein
LIKSTRRLVARRPADEKCEAAAYPGRARLSPTGKVAILLNSK